MDKEQPKQDSSPTETKTPTAPVASTGAKKAASGLAIAAMVVGIISVVLGWTPFLGFALGATALILGIIGLKKKVEGKGMSIAGVVTGGIAVAWNIFVTIAFIASLAIFGAAVSTAGQAANEMSKALTAYEKTQLAQINAKKDFKKGTTAKFDVFDVKVNSVTRNYVPESEYSQAGAGKELIVVNVTVKNTDDETKYFTSYDLKVNDNGISDTATFLTQLDPEFEGGSMSPNASSTGNIVYEVNKDATDLKLQYETYGYNPTTNKSVTLTYTLDI